MIRALTALALFLPLLAHAEVSELRITKQPGIIYLAPIVMEQQKLVEREAAKLGMPELKARWVTFGASNMLLLWDRTRGQVKGLAGSSATPMWLISNRPEVKSLRDLQPTDK